MYYNDLTGKRFGRLIVLGLSHKRKTLYYWKTQCDCGNFKIVSRNHLTGKQVKSCGCLRINPDAGLNFTITRYKRQARERNYSWELGKEEVRKIILQKCFYCGKYPQNIHRMKGKISREFKYNGIDRIDNKKGYVLGNVVPCCPICNWAKKAMTLQEFEAWIVSVYEHLIADRNA